LRIILNKEYKKRKRENKIKSGNLPSICRAFKRVTVRDRKQVNVYIKAATCYEQEA
jgi:hypothetical protein